MRIIWFNVGQLQFSISSSFWSSFVSLFFYSKCVFRIVAKYRVVYLIKGLNFLHLSSIWILLDPKMLICVAVLASTSCFLFCQLHSKSSSLLSSFELHLSCFAKCRMVQISSLFEFDLKSVSVFMFHLINWVTVTREWIVFFYLHIDELTEDLLS